MRLPNFLIIGAAKSATTSLYEYLTRHPQIFMSQEKETNFFGANFRYQRGLEFYSQFFADAAPDQLCAEASTDYTKFPDYPHTAQRIHEAIPDVKLIYILRNPIDRAYAYYVHQHRRIPYAKRTFEQYIEYTNFCLDGSNYMMQIEQYLPYFSKDQFLFLFTEELRDNTDECLSKTLSFLQINSSPQIIQKLKQAAAQNSARAIEELSTKNYIAKQVKSVSLIRQLLKILPKSWRQKGYDSLTKLPFQTNAEKPYKRAPMLPETRAQLRQYFAEPNRKLSEFLECDLSFWQ